MKTLANCFALLLCCLGASEAQVREELRTMSMGSQNALTVMLPGASAKYAENQWAEFVKSYGKLSTVKKSKEKVVSGIMVLEISKGSKLDVYSLAEELGNDSKMLAWWYLDSAFVTSEKMPEAYAGAVKTMELFAHQVRESLATDAVALQQKELEKRQNELAKLQKENTNLHKDIDSYTKKIEEAEKVGIPANLAEQESTRAQIARLQTSALGATEQKELTKQMKSLDKLTKVNENLHKSIADNKGRITKAEMDIEQNLTDQEAAKTAVEDQEKLVSEAEKALMDIKAQKPK